MAWTLGIFSRSGGSTTWGDDRDASVEIEAGLHDTHDEELAAGINQCINKDGSNAMTGDFDAGTNNINNVVDPTTDQQAATKKYVDDNFGAGLASNDELLIRLATHTTIPTGFTIGTTDNKAVKITGNEAASADGGTVSFSAALVAAHATVIATEAAHFHSAGSLVNAAHAHVSSGLGAPGSSFDPTGSSHTHAISGNTSVGSAHRHSITLGVQHRDFHTIVKT